MHNYEKYIIQNSLCVGGGIELTESTIEILYPEIDELNSQSGNLRKY